MSETKQLPAIPTTVPAEITNRFNIGMTEVGFQKLADEASLLVFNADNILAIKEFIAKGKVVENKIKLVHEEGKAPAWAICKNFDNAKNAFLAQKDFVFSEVEKKYNSLCIKIAADNKAIEEEKQRKQKIKDGIDQVAVHFANIIANAKTTKELTAIEARINLEKSYKHKYFEFLPDAITKFKELNANLKTQKENVKDLERLEQEKNKAIESGNDEQALQLMDKIENKEAAIEEQKINIQEAVTSLPTNTEVIEPEVMITTVKAKRSVWKWEVVNHSELVKKAPQWTVVTPNKEAIDSYLAGKKSEGITTEEFTTAGVRFFLDKTY